MRLLADCQLALNGYDRLSTKDLIASLAEDEEAPWGGWHNGSPISPRSLAGLLEPFGIHSRQIRLDDVTLKGAGLEHRSPYALRHTFASFAIVAGVPLFELSRFMGTSVEQIGRTYGHLLPDSLDRARTALDGFLATEQKPQEAFRD